MKMVSNEKDLLEKAYEYTYLDVYTYVKLHLCYFPPCTQNAAYYNDVFSNLLLSSRM